MNRSWRTFTLVALLVLSVLVLAQMPAQAQYRRPYYPVVRPLYVPPVVPYIAPRAFVATPPPIVPYANSFTYTPLGLNLNQVAALNVLRIQTQLYNSLYNPYYLYGYPYTLQGPINYNTPGVAYNPYGIYNYNPYFAAFGFR